MKGTIEALKKLDITKTNVDPKVVNDLVRCANEDFNHIKPRTHDPVKQADNLLNAFFVVAKTDFTAFNDELLDKLLYLSDNASKFLGDKGAYFSYLLSEFYAAIDTIKLNGIEGMQRKLENQHIENISKALEKKKLEVTLAETIESCIDLGKFFVNNFSDVDMASYFFKIHQSKKEMALLLESANDETKAPPLDIIILLSEIVERLPRQRKFKEQQNILVIDALSVGVQFFCILMGEKRINEAKIKNAMQPVDVFQAEHLIYNFLPKPEEGVLLARLSSYSASLAVNEQSGSVSTSVFVQDFTEINICSVVVRLMDIQTKCVNANQSFTDMEVKIIRNNVILKEILEKHLDVFPAVVAKAILVGDLTRALNDYSKVLNGQQSEDSSDSDLSNESICSTINHIIALLGELADEKSLYTQKDAKVVIHDEALNGILAQYRDVLPLCIKKELSTVKLIQDLEKFAADLVGNVTSIFIKFTAPEIKMTVSNIVKLIKEPDNSLTDKDKKIIRRNEGLKKIFNQYPPVLLPEAVRAEVQRPLAKFHHIADVVSHKVKVVSHRGKK